MDKKAARRYGLDHRNALDKETRQLKSRMIVDLLQPYIDRAETIGCYVSMNTEVNTHSILQYCLDQKKTICAPIIRNHKLLFMTVCSLDDLQDAPFHTKEPVHGEIISPADIDLMIVPLSAFDERGNRTGYGKGYYDSILHQCALKIGIGFLEQKVDSIETDPWDVRLDDVIYA